MALALPVMLMLLFVYLFGGALDVGTAYVTYVVPGVLLLCVGFGAAGTAVAVSWDLATGVVDRLRSWAVGATAFLTGHVVASVMRNAVATVLVLLVAVASGFSFFLPFLAYPSSAFVPVGTMPHWLQLVARHQPVTAVAEALRALLLDRPVGSSAVPAVLWATGITVVAVEAATFLFRRRLR